MGQGELPRISALVARADPGFGLRIVRVGVVVTLGLAVASTSYTLLTWSEPDRAVLLAISLVAFCDAIVIYLLRRPISASPHVDALFAAWNAAHIGAAGLAAYVDGGVESPYVTVLFVSVAFAAVTLPRVYLTAIAALDVLVLFVIATAEHSWPASLLFRAPALVAVGFVCSVVADERHARLVALEDARSEMLQRLARVIEFRDLATGTHVERMSEYAVLIARQLGWSGPELHRLRAAASMHDIGKVAVPDAILLKRGPLTEDERRTMEQHTLVGAQMLSGSSSAELELAAEIALSHHERYDGRGYPRGLAGADVPLTGRIVAVADVFDALTSDRVYRPAMSLDEALAIMRDGRGTQFDPLVLDAFEVVLPEILEARQTFGSALAMQGLGDAEVAALIG